MKKLLLTLSICLLIATPVFASEFRIIADMQFSTRAEALKVLNAIEKSKADMRVSAATTGYISYVKLVESWDTDFTNKPEHTLLYVDLGGAIITHKEADFAVDLSSEIAELALEKADAELKAKEKDDVIKAKQAELDAQNP